VLNLVVLVSWASAAALRSGLPRVRHAPALLRSPTR
jgi:hypothetical protein